MLMHFLPFELIIDAHMYRRKAEQVSYLLIRFINMFLGIPKSRRQKSRTGSLLADTFHHIPWNSKIKKY